MRLSRLSMAGVLATVAAHAAPTAHPKFGGVLRAVAAASDAPVIAFVTATGGSYVVWVSRDDGATFEPQPDTVREDPEGRTLEVDRAGHVTVEVSAGHTPGAICETPVGDLDYVIEKGRMLAIHDDDRSDRISIPGVDLADPQLRCTIAGNEHAVYARIETRRGAGIFRVAGTKARRIGSGYHREPVAVDSHGRLLAIGYPDRLLRGTVELAARAVPAGCFTSSDEVTPATLTRGLGTLVDGTARHAGYYCDAADRIVVADVAAGGVHPRGTIYALARTAGARVRQATVTGGASHDGCAHGHNLGCQDGSWSRFESPLATVEVSAVSGPLDIALVSGKQRLACLPQGDALALITCSTRTHLAYVQATACSDASAGGTAERLQLVLVNRGGATGSTTTNGRLVSTDGEGTRWTYHFDPDVTLVVTSGAAPGATLQVGAAREECVGFAF